VASRGPAYQAGARPQAGVRLARRPDAHAGGGRVAAPNAGGDGRDRQAERTTIAEAGERYIEHLATVKRRKRTTIQDYRGYLRRHLAPHFGEGTLDRIEPDHVERYLRVKLATLSPKTVANHLTFLHGLFGWRATRPARP
jgi:hypothetical protein